MYLTCVLEWPLAVEIPLKLQQKTNVRHFMYVLPYHHRSTHFISGEQDCLKYLLSLTGNQQGLLHEQWQLRLCPAQPVLMLLLLVVLDLQSKFHILVLGLTKYSNIFKMVFNNT